MTIFLSVLFGLASMLAYSFANVISQPLARKSGSAQVLYLRGLVISLILAVICIPQYHRFHDVSHVLFALALGIGGYIPVLAFTQGLRVSRVGIVAPIGATSALLTVVLAFFILDSPLNALQWTAIAMVVAANVAISVNPKDLRKSNVMQLESGILFALIAAAGWGLFYFFLIYPTRALGPWVSAFLVELGVTIAAGLHILLGRQDVRHRDALSLGMSGTGICIVIGTVAYTVGVFSYDIGIVAVLSNSTALASALLAAYFFKEKLTRLEKITAGIMIAGVILVSIP